MQTLQVEFAEFSQGVSHDDYELDELRSKDPLPMHVITFTDFPCEKYKTCERPEIITELFLGFLNNPTLKINEPLKIFISKDNEQLIAEAPELDTYGLGNSLSEAILDLQLTVVELYETLTKDRKNLGPHMVGILNILEQKISKE